MTDGTTFDLSNTPITSDITLKAVWALNGSSEDWSYGNSTISYYRGDNTITELVIPPFIDGNKMEIISSQGGLFYYTDNNNITKVTISEGILEIGLTAFRSSTITSVTIPNSATYIGSQTFSFCRALTSITIPNSVTYIGEGAFENSSLTNITMPNNITIEGSAFNDCNIESVNGNPHNGLFYSNGLNNGDTLVSYGGKSTEVDFIPSSVTSIGSNAFEGCKSVTSITIPSSVTSIGDWAFSSCSNLTSIIIPDSVNSIGSNAFYYSGIKSISAPSSLKGQEGNWGVSSDIITWRD